MEQSVFRRSVFKSVSGGVGCDLPQSKDVYVMAVLICGREVEKSPMRGISWAACVRLIFVRRGKLSAVRRYLFCIVCSLIRWQSAAMPAQQGRN